MSDGLSSSGVTLDDRYTNHHSSGSHDDPSTVAVKKEEEENQKVVGEDTTHTTPPNVLEANTNHHQQMEKVLEVWRRYATTSSERGLRVGSIVFAPYRFHSSPLFKKRKGEKDEEEKEGSSVPYYYDLAEVTGIQVSAQTVTVSSLWCEPGVEDETVCRLTELLPVPIDFFPTYRPNPSSPAPLLGTQRVHRRYLSLLDLLYDRKPWEGPVLPSLQEKLHSLQWRNAEEEGCHPIPVKMISGHVNSTVVPSPVVDLVMDGNSFHYDEKKFWSIHNFLKCVFRALGSPSFSTSVEAVEGASTVVVVIFDSYSTLNRFDVYHSYHGSRVTLLEEEESDTGWEEGKGEDAETTVGKLHYYCVLYDDFDYLYHRVILPRNVVKGGGGAPFIYLEEVYAPSERTPTPTTMTNPPTSKIDSIYQTLSSSLNTTGGRGGRKRKRASEEKEPASVVSLVRHCPLYLPSSGSSGAHHSVKIASHIFEDRKIIVPPSVYQLFLLKTVLTEGGDSIKGNTTNVMERIATGNLTDAAIKQMTLQYGTASLFGGGDSLFDLKLVWRMFYNQVSLHPHLSAVFPIFPVLRGLLDDLVHSWNHSGERIQKSTVFPRISLVFCGSGSNHQNNVLFLRVLRQYVSPYAVMTLQNSSNRGSGKREEHMGNERNDTHNVNNNSTVTQWTNHGGVLLLFCDEIITCYSDIHLRSDIVVSCGRTAAAWCATVNHCGDTVEERKEGNRPRQPTLYFALLSEVEVVSSPSLMGHRFQTWDEKEGGTGEHADNGSLFDYFYQHYQEQLKGEEGNRKSGHKKDLSPPERRRSVGGGSAPQVKAHPSSTGDMFKVLSQGFRFYHYLENSCVGECCWARSRALVRKIVGSKIVENKKNEFCLGDLHVV